MKDPGVCRYCASDLGAIQNRATMKRSPFVACPHCDSPCLSPSCKRCARMRSTVRIVDKPDAA